MSCRVPSVSPLTRRDAIQKSSCAVVNTPAALACANAVDPGSAPGLERQDLQVVVQVDDRAGAGDPPRVVRDESAAVEHLHPGGMQGRHALVGR